MPRLPRPRLSRVLKRSKLSDKQIKAAILLGRGETERNVAREVRVGKGTLHRWKQIPEFTKLLQTEAEKATNKLKLQNKALVSAYAKKDRDNFANYLDELRIVKERQKKWAGAITETGIRSLKVVNSYLSLAEKAAVQKVSSQEMALIKLIPSLMRAASDTVSSASDAEDKAYSLVEIGITLDELSQNLSEESRAGNLKTIPPPDLPGL